MIKIVIRIRGKSLDLSIGEKTDHKSMNNTNLIDVNQMVFSDLYIKENPYLLTSFLDSLIYKKDINHLIFKTNYIAELILPLVVKNNSIEAISLEENEEISFEIYKSIFENKAIKKIDCYSMLPFMIEELIVKEKRGVNTRLDIYVESEFLKTNELNRYSEFYNLKSIIIDKKLDETSIKDLNLFLKINTKLKLINLIYYSKDLIIFLIDLLDKYNKTNIKVRIYHNNQEHILPVVEEITTLKGSILKKNKIDLKILYNKEYKKKYGMKQINLNLFRTILLIVIAICLGSILTFNAKTEMDEKRVVNTTKDILSIKESFTNKKKIGLTKDEEQTSKTVKQVNSVMKAYYTQFDKVFEKLKEINPDTVGWITVNNTFVDYPVVQTSDNKYYLNRDFYGKKNIHGWIYMDYRNNVKNFDDNTILYGHQNKQGLMFDSLEKTIKPSWYNNSENQIMTYTTVDKTYYFQIFSIYVIKETNDYLINNFRSKENQKNFIKMLKDRSVTDFNVKVDEYDKILTLSTCYQGPGKRLVVHGKLLR